VKRPIIAGLAVLLVATAAVGQNLFQRVAAFFGGIIVAPRGLASSTNAVTRMLASGSTRLDFDSPDAGCTDRQMPSTTLAGARLGDPCFVSPGAIEGNGTELSTQEPQAIYGCFVAADAGVFVRRCNVLNTAVDPDAGLFQVRIISSAP
jgi:hypothetical protein